MTVTANYMPILVFMDLALFYVSHFGYPTLQTDWANFLNTVYFRRGLTCTLGLTNDLIDGGQPRAKPHLHKVKPNHI